MNPIMWTFATFSWICLLTVGCVFVAVMALMAAIVGVFVISIKRKFLEMRRSIFKALLLVAVAMQTAMVKWHIIQYVPRPCEVAPGNSTAPAQNCFDRIEKTITRNFPDMETAEKFVATKPRSDYLEKYRANITDIIIESTQP